MDMTSAGVLRIAMQGPGDASGLVKLIDTGALDPRTIIAIVGKTEGNGGVNDFTREYATAALSAALASRLDIPARQVEARIAFIMSGGTEGVLSPHITVFTRTRVQSRQTSNTGKRLSIGIAHSRAFLPEEIGRSPQISETAASVEAAMADAGIAHIEDVHFVQVKCPLLTSERIKDAAERHRSTVTESAYGSMGYSRGASALGVALALKEIDGQVGDADVLKNWDLHSNVASISAGIELMNNVVVVMGNSASSASDFVISHSVMQDAIDIDGAIRAFVGAGLLAEDRPLNIERERLINVFAKAEASPTGKVRGYRHTMLEDSDINATRHARAAVGGLLAGLCGTGAVYVSGGAEHQGPAGGGPIAVVARV
jgi:cyanuric acid amidohydrolase